MQAFESAEYKEQIANEKRQFDLRAYDKHTLLEQISEGMDYMLQAFDWKVASVLGMAPFDYIVSEINARPGANILSLGSGPCGVEIALAKRFAAPFQLTCLDLNPKLLKLGQEKAAAEGIAMRTIEQDANLLKLEENYDVVLAHAALHHFINFEHIFSEIHHHLTDRGVFFAHEPVPRNGMLLWPETEIVLNQLFAAIPPRYRRSRLESGWFVHETFPAVELAKDEFECIRSQDIVPLLEQHFAVCANVQGYAFLRRFVEGAFGYNYDLTREEDRVILDMLEAFDTVMTTSRTLKPENVFMVMARKTVPVAAA